MMKHTRALVAVFCMLAFLAGGLTMAGEQGNDKKGKALFKEHCKSCHGKDGDGGEVTPIVKTQSQWERYFKKDEHKEGEALSDMLTAEQLLDIKTFLVNHAADSDQPETCG